MAQVLTARHHAGTLPGVTDPMSDSPSEPPRRTRAVQETFDSISDRYADEVAASASFAGLDLDYFTEVKVRRLLEVVGRQLGPSEGVSVLDVGCGVGVTDRFLVDRVGRLSGIDLSPNAIAQARLALPGVHYQSYDGGTMPFDDASFDVSFAINVFHHVPLVDRATAMGEMSRVTRPGGLVVIFEHNPWNPLTRRAVSNCPFDEDAILLKRNEVARLLTDARCSPVESAYILFIPLRARFVDSVERAIRWVPLGAQYYVAARR